VGVHLRKPKMLRLGEDSDSKPGREHRAGGKDVRLRSSKYSCYQCTQAAFATTPAPQTSAFPETLSSKSRCHGYLPADVSGVRHANIICHTQQNSAIPRTPARQASVILWEISVWSWRDIDDWLPLASVAPGWGAIVQQNVVWGSTRERFIGCR
jgi:hypothetical protein